MKKEKKIKQRRNFTTTVVILLVLFITGVVLIPFLQKKQDLRQRAQTVLDPLDWTLFVAGDGSFSFKYPQRLTEKPQGTYGVLMPQHTGDNVEYQNTFADISTYVENPNLKRNNIDTGVRYDGFNLLIFSNTSDLSLADWTREYMSILSRGFSYYTQESYNAIAVAQIHNSIQWLNVIGYGDFPINLYVAKLSNGNILVINKIEKQTGSMTQELESMLKTFSTPADSKATITKSPSNNPTITHGVTTTPTLAPQGCSIFLADLQPVSGVITSARGSAKITIINIDQTANEVKFNYSIVFDGLPQSEIIDMFITNPGPPVSTLGIGASLLDGINKKEYNGVDYMTVNVLEELKKQASFIRIDTENQVGGELRGGLICDGNSTPVTPSPPLPSISPVPGGINPNLPNTQAEVSIKIHGIGLGGNKLPKNLSRPVMIAIYNLENNFIAIGNGFATYDGKDLFRGILNLGGVESGTYYIRVAGPWTLLKAVKPEFQKIQNGTLNKLPQVTLMQGAYAQTSDWNTITLDDYNLYVDCLLQNVLCNFEYPYGLDINDNGKVDVVDYNLILDNYRSLSGA